MQTTISITVKSADTAGMFTTMLEGEVLVESSAEPLLAAARTLIERRRRPQHHHRDAAPGLDHHRA